MGNLNALDDRMEKATRTEKIQACAVYAANVGILAAQVVRANTSSRARRIKNKFKRSN